VLEASRPGEIYNISSGNEIPNSKIVESILQIMGRPKTLMQFVEDRPGHDIRYSLNSEKLRSQFVTFAGKMLLEIRRDEFIMGSLDNDWPGVFSEFSGKIKQNTVPGIYDKIIGSFSTTGPVEKAANEIILLDAVKSYFDCLMRTRCGIPEVILEGTKEDWKDIEKKTTELSKSFELGWWLTELIPILSDMAATAAGMSRRDLWQNWYKLSDGSGGPFVQGNIIKFFPYLKNYKTGECTNKVYDFEGDITTDRLPTGLSSAPFVWDYYLTKYKMGFVAGFVGCTQDKETMAVRPKIGWGIVNEGSGFDSSFVRTCAKCNEQKMVEQFKYSLKIGYKKPLCEECYWNMDNEERSQYKK
jgi:hypothetical protein